MCDKEFAQTRRYQVQRWTWMTKQLVGSSAQFKRVQFVTRSSYITSNKERTFEREKNLLLSGIWFC